MHTHVVDSSIGRAALCALALVVGLTGAPGHAGAAAAPGTITFTARLADAGGPVDGAHDFDFALFDAPSGGAIVWQETQSGVQVAEGLLAVQLGGSTPLGAIFDGDPLYLEVTVDGTLLTGRVQISSVPYALRAAVAAVAEALAPGLLAQLDAAYLKKGMMLACGGGAKMVGIDPVTGNVVCGADQLGPTYTAGLGISITGTSVAVDFTQTQRRLGGSCGPHAFLRAVAQDGTVTCGSPLIAGSGGLGIDAQNALLIVPGGVSSERIANGTIQQEDLADQAVNSDKIKDSSIQGVDVGTATLTGAHVANDGLNADDLILPMSNASAGALLTLSATTTSNRQFPIIGYVPTSNQQCWVSASVNITNAGASATGEVGVRTVIRNNTAGTTAQDTTAASILGGFGSSGKASAEKTFIFGVTAGNNYDFGCQVSASGDHVGDSMACTIAYFCQ